MEDFLRACHNTVLDHDAKPLSAKMGLPHVSLLQRANPDNDAHHLTVEHLYGILLHTQDMRPLAVLADEFGKVLVDKEAVQACDLDAAFVQATRAMANLMAVAADALADGRVSRTELAALKHAEENMLGHVAVLIASARVG